MNKFTVLYVFITADDEGYTGNEENNVDQDNINNEDNCKSGKYDNGSSHINLNKFFFQQKYINIYRIVRFTIVVFSIPPNNNI